MFVLTFICQITRNTLNMMSMLITRTKFHKAKLLCTSVALKHTNKEIHVMPKQRK